MDSLVSWKCGETATEIFDFIAFSEEDSRHFQFHDSKMLGHQITSKLGNLEIHLG